MDLPDLDLKDVVGRLVSLMEQMKDNDLSCLTIEQLDDFQKRIDEHYRFVLTSLNKEKEKRINHHGWRF